MQKSAFDLEDVAFFMKKLQAIVFLSLFLMMPVWGLNLAEKMRELFNQNQVAKLVAFEKDVRLLKKQSGELIALMMDPLQHDCKEVKIKGNPPRELIKYLQSYNKTPFPQEIWYVGLNGKHLLFYMSEKEGRVMLGEQCVTRRLERSKVEQLYAQEKLRADLRQFLSLFENTPALPKIESVSESAIFYIADGKGIVLHTDSAKTELRLASKAALDYKLLPILSEKIRSELSQEQKGTGELLTLTIDPIHGTWPNLQLLFHTVDSSNKKIRIFSMRNDGSFMQLSADDLSLEALPLLYGASSKSLQEHFSAKIGEVGLRPKMIWAAQSRGFILDIGTTENPSYSLNVVSKDKIYDMTMNSFTRESIHWLDLLKKEWEFSDPLKTMVILHIQGQQACILSDDVPKFYFGRWQDQENKVTITIDKTKSYDNSIKEFFKNSLLKAKAFQEPQNVLKNLMQEIMDQGGPDLALQEEFKDNGLCWYPKGKEYLYLFKYSDEKLSCLKFSKDHFEKLNAKWGKEPGFYANLLAFVFRYGQNARQCYILHSQGQDFLAARDVQDSSPARVHVEYSSGRDTKQLSIPAGVSAEIIPFFEALAKFPGFEKLVTTKICWASKEGILYTQGNKISGGFGIKNQTAIEFTLCGPGLEKEKPETLFQEIALPILRNDRIAKKDILVFTRLNKVLCKEKIRSAWFIAVDQQLGLLPQNDEFRFLKEKKKDVFATAQENGLLKFLEAFDEKPLLQSMFSIWLDHGELQAGSSEGIWLQGKESGPFHFFIRSYVDEQPLLWFETIPSSSGGYQVKLCSTSGADRIADNIHSEVLELIGKPEMEGKKIAPASSKASRKFRQICAAKQKIKLLGARRNSFIVERESKAPKELYIEGDEKILLDDQYFIGTKISDWQAFLQKPETWQTCKSSFKNVAFCFLYQSGQDYLLLHPERSSDHKPTFLRLRINEQIQATQITLETKGEQFFQRKSEKLSVCYQAILRQNPIAWYGNSEGFVYQLSRGSEIAFFYLTDQRDVRQTNVQLEYRRNCAQPALADLLTQLILPNQGCFKDANVGICLHFEFAHPKGILLEMKRNPSSQELYWWQTKLSLLCFEKGAFTESWVDVIQKKEEHWKDFIEKWKLSEYQLCATSEYGAILRKHQDYELFGFCADTLADFSSFQIKHWPASVSLQGLIAQPLFEPIWKELKSDYQQRNSDRPIPEDWVVEFEQAENMGILSNGTDGWLIRMQPGQSQSTLTFGLHSTRLLRNDLQTFIQKGTPQVLNSFVDQLTQQSSWVIAIAESSGLVAKKDDALQLMYWDSAHSFLIFVVPEHWPHQGGYWQNQDDWKNIHAVLGSSQSLAKTGLKIRQCGYSTHDSQKREVILDISVAQDDISQVSPDAACLLYTVKASQEPKSMGAGKVVITDRKAWQSFLIGLTSEKWQELHASSEECCIIGGSSAGLVRGSAQIMRSGSKTTMMYRMAWAPVPEDTICFWHTVTAIADHEKWTPVANICLYPIRGKGVLYWIPSSSPNITLYITPYSSSASHTAKAPHSSSASDMAKDPYSSSASHTAKDPHSSSASDTAKDPLKIIEIGIIEKDCWIRFAASQTSLLNALLQDMGQFVKTTRLTGKPLQKLFYSPQCDGFYIWNGFQNSHLTFEIVRGRRMQFTESALLEKLKRMKSKTPIWESLIVRTYIALQAKALSSTLETLPSAEDREKYVLKNFWANLSTLEIGLMRQWLALLAK